MNVCQNMIVVVTITESSCHGDTYSTMYANLQQIYGGERQRRTQMCEGFRSSRNGCINVDITECSPRYAASRTKTKNIANMRVAARWNCGIIICELIIRWYAEWLRFNSLFFKIWMVWGSCLSSLCRNHFQLLKRGNQVSVAEHLFNCVENYETFFYKLCVGL